MFIPVLGSRKDFDRFKKKYGNQKKYHIDCDVGDVIKEITNEFPRITFFGYYDYNNSCCSTYHSYCNIIFNGTGITYLGKTLSMDDDIMPDEVWDAHFQDLKICKQVGSNAGYSDAVVSANRDGDDLVSWIFSEPDDELPY